MRKISLIISFIILVSAFLLFYAIKAEREATSANSIIEHANPIDNETMPSKLQKPRIVGKAVVSPEADTFQENKSTKEEPIAIDKNEQYSAQDELPKDILDKAIRNFDDNISELRNAGGVSQEGVDRMESNDLTDAILIEDLPPAVASEARDDYEFRKENGYDKTTESKASDILTSIGQISGTEYPVPNLTFELPVLPASLNRNYQYLGYIYPYNEGELPSYNSIKLVFSHISNNSVLVIHETSLENGSTTLIKEFVNSNILDCPAMLVEKRDSNDRRYGQINWNTKLIGFVIYQFNIEDPTSGLLLHANSIAYENREYLNCKHQEENATNLTTQQQ